MDTASLTRPLAASATRVSNRHATNSVLVDLVAHLVIAFAIGLAASLALAGAVLLLSDDAQGSQVTTPQVSKQINSYSVPAAAPAGTTSNRAN